MEEADPALEGERLRHLLAHHGVHVGARAPAARGRAPSTSGIASDTSCGACSPGCAAAGTGSRRRSSRRRAARSQPWPIGPARRARPGCQAGAPGPLSTAAGGGGGEQHARVPVLAVRQRRLDERAAPLVPAEAGRQPLVPGLPARLDVQQHLADAPRLGRLGRGRPAARAPSRPPRGMASTSWSMTPCGCPFTQRRSEPLLAAAPGGDRLERSSVGAHLDVGAARQARARRAARRASPPGAGAGRAGAARKARPGRARRRSAGRRPPPPPPPARARPGARRAGRRRGRSTAGPASTRRQRPPEPPHVSPRRRRGQAGRSARAGVSTQATFRAKRTSSSSGSGQWRKRSFQGGEATMRSPLSQVRRKAGP